MDTRPCATEQELATWVDAVQTMDATTLGEFERRVFPAYQHASLVPLQVAIVKRRAQLERSRWFRIRPSYSKPTGGSQKWSLRCSDIASVVLTLDTYSHVLPDMQRASASRLDALLFPAASTARS
jgi:hypothetical protein